MSAIINSSLPFSQNNGALWAGKGLSTRTVTGFTLERARLRIILAPEVIASANGDWPLFQDYYHPPVPAGYSSYYFPYYVGQFTIDQPMRFGNKSIRRIDLGQTTALTSVRSLEVGVSNENEWWGPGIRNAIVLSNNAPGFSHLFVRTAHPLATRFGDVEMRWLVGGLTESAYFDTISTNNTRSLAAIAATLQTKWDPNLGVGVARVRRKQTKNQRCEVNRVIQQAIPLDDGTLTTPVSVSMIQALIPLGLRAVEEALLAEVRTLAGPRYARSDEHPDVVRWGAQDGSIYLADQKLPIVVPRVRDRLEHCEVPLATYVALQTPRAQDVGLFRRVLGGLSCREYEAAAEAVPEAFGLARSSVSRRFIRSSARELRGLQERRLDDSEWLVLVLDGKTFAGDQLVLALGVTTTGEKRILGLVQTASENKRVIASFLRELGERGFPLDRQILVVLDGSRGLGAAVREVLGDVPVQRCQWHKRENVVSYLAKSDQPTWRRKLQAAYAHSTYADAKRALERLHRELRVVNEPAAASLAEGLEETLTLHRLNVFPELGVSFKTTNLIESVMARLEAKTRRVTRWRTSDQKLRWCASALWAMERQFRLVKHYRHLPLLKLALQNKLSLTNSAAA